MNAPVESREPGTGSRPRRGRPRSAARRFPFRGFTIVEMLVVIGVLALLLAITVPALRGVQTRTRKTVESNNIRQVYLAWMTYSNFNKDAAAPGYISPDVQKAWRVHYEYPVPPDPQGAPGDRVIPHDIAAPLTWRLFSYLDFNLETIWRYRDVPTMSWSPLVAMARDGVLDYAGIFDVDDLMERIAEEPAFAYNAYHVGGWWEMQEMPGSKTGEEMPLPMFHSAKSVNGGQRVEVVSRSIPGIRRPAELIVFCTASKFANPGVYRRIDDQFPGTHAVMPPFFGDEARWESPPPSQPAYTERIETYVADIDHPTRAPFPRYNNLVTHIHADGSIGTDLPVMLFDMRRWIDNPIRTDEPYAAWFTN